MSNVFYLAPPKRKVSRKKPAKQRRPESATMIRCDASMYEHDFGEANPYSRYLRQHGRRPDRAAATTMARLMGTRLKADDGRLYPPLTDEQREMIRKEQAERERLNEIYRPAGDIYSLAACITLPTEEIIREMPVEHIRMALEHLDAAERRFAEIAAALRALPPLPPKPSGVVMVAPRA